MPGKNAYNIFKGHGGNDSMILAPFEKLHKATQARWAAVEAALTPAPTKKKTKRKARK